MVHKCPRCDRCFKLKHHLHAHLTKKKPCGSSSLHLTSKSKPNTNDNANTGNANGTTVINNYSNISNNLVLKIENLNITKETDFYEELVKKMGEEKAIDFIARSAINGDEIKIFEKLYLEDKDMNEYPLACYKDEIRFKNDDILKSDTIKKMSDMINEKIVNCILTVNIYMVNKMMFASEKEKNTMFESTFNLKKLQSVAERINRKKEVFLNKLTKKIKVKDHPFFLREC